jgi:hypothetical protein
MCPACITTAAMLAASSASGVGVLGLLVIKLRSWRGRRRRTMFTVDRSGGINIGPTRQERR